MKNIPDGQLNTNYDDSGDEIPLPELLHVLFQGKWIIVSVTAFVSMIGVVFSLYLPNIYESEALLAPVDSSDSMSLGGGVGALAGLAGVKLPTAGGEGNSKKAISTLNSLSFFENNILPDIFLPDLMAIKSWNSQTNTLAYDENLYQKNSNTWVRDYSYPEKQIPSAQESFKVFTTKHFQIIEEQKTGFLQLKIKHQSPFIAKQWSELIINKINAYYRQKDKAESEKSVSYLNQQITTTRLAEVKEALAELLQQHIKKLTVIEAKQLYVFEIIDPPAVMELHSKPNRTLICILFALFGGILSISGVLSKRFFYDKAV